MVNDLPLNLDPELLVAYVDKELPPAQMAAVEAALMHNGAARETVRQLRLSAAAAAHAYDAALNELPDRLLLAAGAGAPTPVPQMKPRRQMEPRPPGTRLRRLLPLAATFAALAIGLAGGYELRALALALRVRSGPKVMRRPRLRRPISWPRPLNRPCCRRSTAAPKGRPSPMPARRESGAASSSAGGLPRVSAPSAGSSRAARAATA